MAKSNPVVHFEMGYEDRARMVKFYETVFGWKTQQTGPASGFGYLPGTPRAIVFRFYSPRLSRTVAPSCCFPSALLKKRGKLYSTIATFCF